MPDFLLREPSRPQPELVDQAVEIRLVVEDAGNAQRIGLLPPEVAPNRIRFVGNASLEGARMAAASLSARTQAERLATTAEHVDLSLDPEFQMAFAMAMQFPESAGTPR